MRLPLLPSLSLLLCAAHNVCAQLAPADDFFHRGAQSYLSNNVAQAQSAVDMGLKLYPDDEKLKKLDELLKQQQQQDQQQQDQQQNQDQQNQDQKDQQNQESKDQSQQPKSEEQRKQDEQKQADQKKESPQKPPEPPKPSPEEKDGGQPEDQKGQGQPVAPSQMTPEEAKRLLDAQKGNEQVLQLKPQGKPKDNQKPVKDW